LAIKHVGIFILYPITPSPQQEAHLADKTQNVYLKKYTSMWEKMRIQKKCNCQKNGI